MMRALFITFSKLSWAQRLITAMPPAQRAAARFIAGETHADAIQAVRGLNAKGMVASLDHLGENTCDEQSARQATQEIVVILDAIEQNRVCANVSIKLSQLGLAFREELCRQNLVTILEKARSANNFIRIDMEDSTLTQKTLDTFFWARMNGYSHVGIVIQAYLYRSEADIRLLTESGAHVRLCKGAYKEPPHLAFPKIEDVNINFDRLAGSLLASAIANGMPEISADGRVPPVAAIATHDEKRIHFARQQAERLGLPKRAVEFQMLYGIRRDLQEKLAAQGYPVRVYVPYGKHWYPYFMRRLAERPANVWFLLSNVLRR